MKVNALLTAMFAMLFAISHARADEEVMIDSVRQVDRFDFKTEGAFLHCLNRVASNKIRNEADRWGAQKRNANQEISLDGPSSDRSASPLDLVGNYTTTTPSKVLTLRENLVLLRRALDRLGEESKQYRDLIVSVEIEGRSYVEIAEETGKTPDSIRMKANRAITALAGIFEEMHAARSEEPVKRIASGFSQATDRLSNVSAGNIQSEKCDLCRDAVSCASFDCRRGPRWEVSVSKIFMQRTGLDSTSLYVTNGGQDLLNADDFSFDWEPGIDVSFARRLNECWAVQGRYFWLNDQKARSPTFNLTLPNPSFIQTTPPTPTFGPSNNLFATYRAQLQSAEVNAQRAWCDNLNVFFGFRFINFDEKLRVFEPDFLGEQVWDARNNLYGGQIGVDGLLWCRNRLSLIGSASAGLYANDARTNSRVTQAMGGPGAPREADSFSRDSNVEAAFLGELNLIAEYRLNHRWSIVAGYQLMWLEGVAIAAEQVAGTGIVFAGPTLTQVGSSINVDGNALYHGVRAGLEAAW